MATYGIEYAAPIQSDVFNQSDFTRRPAQASGSTTAYFTNAHLSGTLSVDGDSRLHDTFVDGNLTVSGSTNTNTGAFTCTTLHATSNAQIDGTLGVTGASTLGVLGAGASTLTSLGVTNGATVGGTLGVTGTSTLGVLGAGASTLTSLGVTNGATVGGTLGVTGSCTTSALSCTTINASSTANVGGTVTVDMGSTAINSTYIASDDKYFAGNGVYDRCQEAYITDATNTTNTNYHQLRRVVGSTAKEFIQLGPSQNVSFGSMDSFGPVFSVNTTTASANFGGSVSCAGNIITPGSLNASALVSSGMGGALSVIGAPTVSGAAVFSSTVNVTGASTLGVLGAGASTLTSLGVTNGATVGGTLGVSGTSTLASLGVTNNATVGGTLGVTGYTTLLSPLEITGPAVNVNTTYTAEEVNYSNSGTDRFRVNYTTQGAAGYLNAGYKLGRVINSSDLEWISFGQAGAQTIVLGYSSTPVCYFSPAQVSVNTGLSVNGSSVYYGAIDAQANAITTTRVPSNAADMVNLAYVNTLAQPVDLTAGAHPIPVPSAGTVALYGAPSSYTKIGKTVTMTGVAVYTAVGDIAIGTSWTVTNAIPFSIFSSVTTSGAYDVLVPVMIDFYDGGATPKSQLMSLSSASSSTTATLKDATTGANLVNAGLIPSGSNITLTYSFSYVSST